VELIGTYSKQRSLREKYADLLRRIQEASPRSPLLDGTPEPRQHKRSLSPDDLTDITARYESGASTQQIASRYRISKSRVSAVLREHGIKLRRQGLTDEQAREATNLYHAGHSLAWIAKRFGGISPSTVARVLQQQDVALRPRPGSV
jgi:hypothetical protein